MLRLARGLSAVTLLAVLFAGGALPTAQANHGGRSHFNCNGNKGSTNCQNGLVNINISGVSSNDSDFNATLVKMGDVLTNIDVNLMNLDVALLDKMKLDLDKAGIQVCGIAVQIGLKNINKSYC